MLMALFWLYTQGSLDELRKPYGVPGIELGFAVFKAITLFTIIPEFENALLIQVI